MSPRRSSSQAHRLVELYREAEQGQITPPPVPVAPTPEPVEAEPEEWSFNYQQWELQCLATRLAVPSGSLASRQGKRHAEAIYTYLSKQEYDKIGPHRDQGRLNRFPTRAERMAYDPHQYRRTLIGG